MNKAEKHWDIWVDTGGTFTDCLGIDPAGTLHRTKVLSNSGLRGTITNIISPSKIKVQQDWQAPDGFIKGFEFKVLDEDGSSVKVDDFRPDSSIIHLSKAIKKNLKEGQSFEVISPEESPVLAARLLTQTPLADELPLINLKLATTKATNALLERKGAKVALFITKGFGDLMKIGTQQRPDLFALDIQKSLPLYESVIEIDERIDAKGTIFKSLKLFSLKSKAAKLLEEGITSAAVVCMNSYAYPVHEQKIGQQLQKLGFEYISLSSDLSRFIKILPRAETTLVNAYLSPIMERYLDAVEKSMEKGQLSVMTSAGGLMNHTKYTPKDSLLSGPAAGVVGAAQTGKQAGYQKIISFDMGGTSTDVSRYDSDFDYVFEHYVGDAHLMSPAVTIETVAAGGGSICWFDGNTLRVGPESAGAHPGPACYGAGGPLTLTDINILAGRLDKSNFHIPVDEDAARKKLHTLRDEISKSGEQNIASTTLLEGFLDIANQRMAGAIEKISLRKGYDSSSYALVSFGGAGGQHCCAISNKLNMDTVIIPENAGLLSAYGLGHAVMEHFEEEQILKRLDKIESQVPEKMETLAQKGRGVLSEDVPDKELTLRRRLLFMRLKNQESTLEITYESGLNLSAAFRQAYEQRYGHWPDDAVIEVESIRVVISTKEETNQNHKTAKPSPNTWDKIKDKEIVWQGDKIITPVFDRKESFPGASVKGPALILDPYSTIFVEPGWKVKVDDHKALVLHQTNHPKDQKKAVRPEAIELELFTHRFTSIAEKMGEMLQRTALSVNVKERQDFSCALLNPRGELVVNAPHIPVHLGALGICVREVIKKINMEPGDVVITNHPAYGGSHLPDVTVITPVFTSDEKRIGYAVNRAHHAEIGGIRPGSMPPNATNLAEEGVVIAPMYIIKKGAPRFGEIKKHLLSARYPTRSIHENMTDIQAQVAANKLGAEALQRLAEKEGISSVHHYMDALKNRAAGLMQETIKNIQNGTYSSKELLDDGTPLCARWEIHDTSVTIDFEGTGSVHPYNLNATPAIVNSVVMYVLRVLVHQPVPLNEGLMEAVTLKLPECLLNPPFADDPQKCPAVVGGNIEISQRLTDALLKPFERIACGQGTMNNILFGNDAFGYYETVGGGSGAGPDFDGTDAVHQNMTNTKGTDPEIFEQRYPVRLDKYAIRKNSGGKGKYKGGNGIIREMTFLEAVKLSVLTQHRVQAPYGQMGGDAGKKGKQWVIRKNGKKELLKSSDGCDLEAGDRFVMHTPGGGGYEKKSNNK